MPMELEYAFPLEIFEAIKVLYANEGENKAYQDILLANRSIGKGELGAICVCKSNGFFFSSMDAAALRFALSLQVDILDMHAILRAFWMSGMKTKDEVKEIIRDLDEKISHQ